MLYVTYSGQKVRSNDIINIDITVILNDWHGDTSRMFVVGETKLKAKKLINSTYDAMWEGIKQVRPGNTIGDIGSAIQEHAEVGIFNCKRFLWSRYRTKISYRSQHFTLW